MSLLNEKFTPMLLGEVDKPFDDDEYIYEIKGFLGMLSSNEKGELLELIKSEEFEGIP